MDGHQPGQDPLTLYVAMLRDGARMPTKSHQTDAGWDLYACERVCIPAGTYRNVPTGIAVGIPEGWFGHIVGRSSISAKHGLEVVPAIIDQGYRGELFFQLHNPTGRLDAWGRPARFEVEAGMRMAQLLILPVPLAHWVSVVDLPASDRGTKGFGDSGL